VIDSGNVTFRVLPKRGNVTRLLLFVFGSRLVVAGNVTMLPNCWKMRDYIFVCVLLFGINLPEYPRIKDIHRFTIKGNITK